eukprot:gene13162-17631_t
MIAIGVITITQKVLGGYVMSKRKAFHSPTYLSKAGVQSLQEVHKREYGGQINNVGYPDMGNGLYSQHLSYNEWYELNVAQRIHQNMMESSMTVMSCMIVSGVFSPVISSSLGFTYSFSRFVYMAGYQSKKEGPNGRMLGSTLSLLSELGLANSPYFIQSP